MKAKFGREIGLLMLPVVFLGGLALWNGRALWSGGATPPANKPRLVITKWQKVTPSALDFGRGNLSSWVATVHHEGACPAGVEASPPTIHVEHSGWVFVWKRAGKWHRTIFEPHSSDLDIRVEDVMPRTNPPVHRIYFGLPVALLPRDVQEVRLRGELSGGRSCQSGWVYARSKPIDVALKGAQESWPRFTGLRVRALKLRSIKQQRNPLNTFWEQKYNHDLKVHAELSYSGRVKNGTVVKGRSWVVNAAGKEVWSSSGSFWRNVWYDKRTLKLRNGAARATWLLHTREWPLKDGPYTFKNWVYVDKNEWPLLVTVPLVPPPASKNPGKKP